MYTVAHQYRTRCGQCGGVQHQTRETVPCQHIDHATTECTRDMCICACLLGTPVSTPDTEQKNIAGPTLFLRGWSPIPLLQRFLPAGQHECATCTALVNGTYQSTSVDYSHVCEAARYARARTRMRRTATVKNIGNGIAYRSAQREERRGSTQARQPAGVRIPRGRCRCSRTDRLRGASHSGQCSSVSGGLARPPACCQHQPTRLGRHVRVGIRTKFHQPRQQTRPSAMWYNCARTRFGMQNSDNEVRPATIKAKLHQVSVLGAPSVCVCVCVCVPVPPLNAQYGTVIPAFRMHSRMRITHSSKCSRRLRLAQNRETGEEHKLGDERRGKGGVWFRVQANI